MREDRPEGARSENAALLGRARELFGRALEIPAPRREEFVIDEAGADHALRDLLLDLLRERESLGSFLRSSPFHAAGSGDLLAAAAPEAAGGRGLLPPGTRLGDFEIEELVAAGGTGEVYKAAQVTLGRRAVALKILHPGRISSRERDRFLREARLAARVHHPNLVPVYGSGEDAARGILFYAMRFVEGPSLLDVLFLLSRSDEMEPSEEKLGAPGSPIVRHLVERFAEVADGLATLHSHGLIHGDVKPGNMVLEGGEGDPWTRPVVLVDFGLVRYADDTVSTVWATPGYAAPEVLLGRPADARSDVFALGASMHDLLSRRLPDRRRKAGDIEPERLSKVAPGIDPDLEAIVARATDRDPDARYGDAAGLRADLRAWLAGDPVTARRLVGFERVRRWVRRHPASVLRWIAITAGGLVGSAILLLGVTSAVDLVKSSVEIRRAWNSADLERLTPALRDVSPFLSGLLLPDNLANAADALRRGDAADPVGRVLKALAAEGPAAARLLAAAHVEDEGLVAHPVLGGYLANVLADAGVGRGPRGEAVRLVARLFHERPDMSPADVEASAPLRRALLALLLATDTDFDTSLYALTALSGCGSAEEVPAILDWLVEAPVEDETLVAERLRLGLRALGRVFLRGHACGFGDRLSSVVGADEFEQLRARIAPFVGRLPIYPFYLEEAYWHLYRNLVLLHRAAGTRPPPLESVRLRGAVPLDVLGALRDPTLVDAIVAGLSPVQDEVPHLTRVHFVKSAEAVGMLDDPQLAAEIGERVRGWIEQATRVNETIPAIWPEILDIGRLLAHGEHFPHEPDIGTHVGELVRIQGQAWQEEDLPAGPADAPLLLARWDLREEAVAARGDALSLAVLAPSARVDRTPNHEHVVLGVAGVAAMRLTFQCPQNAPALQLRLRLVAQKAIRTLLPWSGEASLDFFLDGAPAGTGVALTEGGIEEIVIPLVRRSPIERQRHEVVIRLSPRSTTTAWVWVAEISYVVPPP